VGPKVALGCVEERNIFSSTGNSIPAFWSSCTLELTLKSLRAGMSNFNQVVIDFLVSKLPVIYLALSKNIGKNNTTHVVCCKSNIH
jgi:hypothetical protein